MIQRPRALWCGICTAVCLVSAQGARADAVAQWKFDEAPGATVAVDSVGDHDGTLAGSADFVAGGISGNALTVTIAGNGHVNMGDYFRFDSGDFAIVAWAQTAPDDPTPDYLIVSKHRATIVAGYIIGINANGTYGRQHKAWFYQSNLPGNEPISTTTVNDGQWHQIVAVYRAGRQARIYVDGAPHEDSRNALPISTISAPFLVAGLDWGGTPRGTFNGLLDEIQLYDHWLSPEQVQYLFEHPTETVIGPLGDLNCDDQIDFADINPFVMALSNPAGYQALFPDCSIRHGDMNYDGSVDFGDINPFVKVLTE